MDRGGYFPGASARPTNDMHVKGWDWNVRVAGRPVTRRVTLAGVSSASPDGAHGGVAGRVG